MVFGKIKQIFLKSRTAEENADDDFLVKENPNFITDPEKIIRLFGEVEQGSPLCSLQLNDLDQEFTSSILGIQKEQNQLLFDELNPKEGNALLQASKSAKVLLYYKGVRVTFNISDIERAYSRGISYYKCPLPDRIYYPQRRNAPRIEIPTLNIPFSGVSQRTGLSVSGYVYDLSRTGIGILIAVGKVRMQRGDIVERCQISFEDYIMDFDLDIRFVKPGPVGSSKMQIGGLFLNTSSRSLTKLSYFVTSLERLKIRKQKS